eukprot:g5898.t1.1.5e174189 g5898  g5898.t1 contig20:391916-392433(-)
MINISVDWLCGQLAFIYSFNKVKPAVIVDKLIEIAVDIIVPGRGAGESNLFMRNLRSFERDGDRISKELGTFTFVLFYWSRYVIVNATKHWDCSFPF